MEPESAPECYPISTVPGTTALFRDYAEPAASGHEADLRRWYPTDPFSMHWSQTAPVLEQPHLAKLTDALLRQTDRFDSSGAVLANIERLKNGAAAVVTGQQVGLFGGPLLTLLKAATAIRKAQDATRLSGREHVPVFWLASEDHDLAEVDQVSLLSKSAVEKLTLGLDAHKALPVGSRILGDRTDEGRHRLEAELDRACELLQHAPICDLLRECYAPGATLAGAFGRLLTKVFAPFGLVVMDAATRDFHALGAATLRAAIEHADELEAALLARSRELEAAGYHAQVLITPATLCSFWWTPKPARACRCAAMDGERLEGRRAAYSTADLLAILDAEPERLSPNALLRPVFQDTILPTAAYIGGPAEIAYFAQSAVVYERILGPHHAGAAAPERHAGRAGHRHHAGRARGQLRADSGSQDARRAGPAPGRARHAHRSQAQARRRRQRHGHRTDRAHRVHDRDVCRPGPRRRRLGQQDALPDGPPAPHGRQL
jgi:bacillithiol biosynthesis cysteine-adding enzyme BshC